MSIGATTSTGGLKRALTADPRKTAFLAILLAVLGVVGWRTLAKSSGPAVARASATPAVASSVAAPATLRPGTDNPRAPGNRAGTLAAWSQTPTGPLGRNLFTLRPDAFVKKWGVSDELMQPGSFWTQLAKSMSLQTDLQSRRQTIVETVVADAGKLKLTSTMMGTKPRAIVNEQIVEVGDVVASFRVLNIGPRGITVEREGIRLEIQMK